MINRLTVLAPLLITYGRIRKTLRIDTRIYLGPVLETVVCRLLAEVLVVYDP